jgi:hypothetical protein
MTLLLPSKRYSSTQFFCTQLSVSPHRQISKFSESINPLNPAQALRRWGIEKTGRKVTQFGRTQRRPMARGLGRLHR